jgi:hypothetical protein
MGNVAIWVYILYNELVLGIDTMGVSQMTRVPTPLTLKPHLINISCNIYLFIYAHSSEF